MKHINVRVAGGIVVLTCGAAMAQVQVRSTNLSAKFEAREIVGKVMVASTSESTLKFTESALTVKLRNVSFGCLLPDDPAAAGGVPKYVLPQNLTLDGIDIDGKPLELSAKTFSGPYINVLGYGGSRQSTFGNDPLIVYLTLPMGTNASECRLILTDAQFNVLVARPKEEKSKGIGEQHGGGYSSPAAQSPKPTP